VPGCLIAASFWDLSNLTSILVVVVGLGTVIFVHELGHFAVAKLCGVKCEKFYLGFDIFGWKLFRFRWGETEYGIGVLPLGGYVKMLGQDDNPARAAAEMERARIRQTQRDAGELKTTVEETQEDQYILDPRSYMAQPVWKRMAIISAGVVMNVIFAWVFATVAYGLNVKETPCIVGSALPGETAWRAGLQPGDEILEIGTAKNPRWRDLQNQVVLGDIDDGVPLVVQRPDVSEPLRFTVHPARTNDYPVPRVGLAGPRETRLFDQDPGPALEGTSAYGLFERGDEIVEIDGRAVADYTELLGVLAHRPNDTLQVKVHRPTGEDGAFAEATISLPPNPMRVVGAWFEMGPVVAVQDGSPAAKAGIQVGDVIEHIEAASGDSVTLAGADGPSIDPLFLPEWLRRRANQKVTITLRRGGQAAPIKIADIELRDPPWYDESMEPGTPASAPALGVAYRVESRVAHVVPGSPAASAGVQAGDELLEITFVPPASEDDKPHFDQQQTADMDVGLESPYWPYLVWAMQKTVPGTTLTLELKRGGALHTANLEPVTSTVEAGELAWNNPDRGLLTEPLYEVREVSSFGEAMALGLDETWHGLTTVVRFLRKLMPNLQGRSQVSLKATGSLFTIFAAGKQTADLGIPAFLLFLTLLSANLAVLNFLPIPVLDGGHMLFLALEKIRGKPVSERTFLRATYAGLFLILGLMIFTIGLDITRLPRLLNLWG
jgi:regulator of sigma E protease